MYLKIDSVSSSYTLREASRSIEFDGLSQRSYLQRLISVSGEVL
jgi:hypothetical protein